MIYKRCNLCENLIVADDEYYLKYGAIMMCLKNDSFKNMFFQKYFCNSCLVELDNHIKNFHRELCIKTNYGIMKMKLKIKKKNTVLEIKNKKYHHPLFFKNFNSINEAKSHLIINFVKLKNNQFKIIRNIESLDENYRRVFSRIRFSILFLD